MSNATRETNSPRSSAPHIAVLASAVLIFLVFASAAGAAATGSLPPAPASTATSAVPVEQVAETAANAVSVEPAKAPTASPEPQPTETPQGASIPDSIREKVVSAVAEPAAASDLPASTRPAGRVATSVVDSVATQTTSVVSAKTGPGATVVPAIQRRVGALDESVRRSSDAVVEGVHQELSGTVEEVRRGVAEKTSGLSEGLTPRPGGALLPPTLPNSSMASTAAALPSAGLLQTNGDSAQASPAGFLESRPAGFFSRWNPIASGGPTAKFLTSAELDRVEKVEAARHSSGTLSLTTVSDGSGGIDAATLDSRGPTSPDVPLPAPRLPADAVASSGSGATLFVPFAALLALLALVAPASMRRLREAPGFRAPIPFVCALERPG